MNPYRENSYADIPVVHEQDRSEIVIARLKLRLIEEVLRKYDVVTRVNHPDSYTDIIKEIREILS